LVFGIWGWIYRHSGIIWTRCDLRISTGLTALPESKIVSDAKQPTLQILPRLTALQVLKQGEKDFLYNFLSILDRQAERKRVAKQPVAELVEEIDHFLFERRRLRKPIGLGRRSQERAESRIHV
jgi:hypothetical protein